ncbi:MAG: type II toxin-antitoxin system PemK/MazF family toxin [Candidatus Lambdaproteobacteria bacterium]|nr:type II toxin-antitoxin system PemK/MazF family toxin [Candidatus Lambdaproteobacteria bacterium]
MTYEAFDVVVVPFPFTDRGASKRRPALVLSDRAAFNAPSGHAVLAMITSKGTTPWPLDVPVSALDEAGLSVASVVRMKLFTLDQRLILRRAGHLHERDRQAVKAALALLLHAG